MTVRPRLPPADMLASLARYFEHVHARDAHATVLVARDRAGAMLSWCAARSPARLAGQHPRAHEVRRERHPLDTRPHVAHHPQVRELVPP